MRVEMNGCFIKLLYSAEFETAVSMLKGGDKPRRYDSFTE
jgi:hypothetical protein